MNTLVFRFSLVCICFSLSLSARGQQIDSTSHIFRYADLGLPGKIMLGEPFALQGKLGIQESDGITRIPLSYPRTAWVRVFTDVEGRIGAMVFTYDASFDFAEALANYTADLGEPEQGPGSQGDIFSWRDDQTQFDLVQRKGAGGDTNFSVLRDLELAPATVLPALAQMQADTVALTMDDVLSTTMIWDIIAGKDAAFIEVIKTNHQDLVRDSLNYVSALIEEEYAPLALYDHARNYMEMQNDAEMMGDLIGWLFDETTLKLRTMMNENEPELTLEEYALELQSSPPEPERVQLLLRFVRANQVEEFFVGLDTATRNASNDILTTLPGSPALMSPLTEEEILQMSQNYRNYMLVIFLWLTEPLTNDQIAHLVTNYETASGQWYVETYSDALAYALAEAGRNVASRISSPR